MRALRVAGCVVLGLVSFTALALLLPFLKEGFDRSELRLFVSIAGGFAAAAAAWWALNRRHRASALTGMALLAAPVVIYAGLSAQLGINEWRGRRLARTVRVLSLRETEIRWPGLPGPVGLRLEIEVEHGVGLEGNLFPPKVVMGRDPRPASADYFSGPLEGGVDAFLSVPLFEPGRPQQPARDVLLRPGRTRIEYELFPGRLNRRLENGVCLEGTIRHADDGRTAAEEGSHLGAAWFFAAPSGVSVDLGAPLTDALRHGSAYEGKAAAWTALLRSLDPATLVAAGYEPCPGAQLYGGTCYCAP